MRDSSVPGFAHRPVPARSRLRPRLAALAAVMLACGGTLAGVATASVALAPAAAADTSLCPDANVAAFGPNVCVFNPSMTQAAIQADLNAISTQQVPVASQFDSQRYAVFFEPGTYGSHASPLVFQVGYYTEVAGLGAMPQDTVINGAIEVFNNLCSGKTRLQLRRQLLAVAVEPDAQRRPVSLAAGLRAAGSRCLRRWLREQR